MKQILQNPRTGDLELVDVPIPAVGPGQVRVRTGFSVVSPGTEKMALEFARQSLLGKALGRPDLVRQVARKLRKDGIGATVQAVKARLDVFQPLGYSSAGMVDEVGEGVTRFAPGNRIACAGAGYANHAEFAVIPENLAARVPDRVALEDAAFATVGAIALQGVRVTAPDLGETVVVIGLGLIGQLTVQLLRANGCRVLAIDVNTPRAKQSLDQGARWSAHPSDSLDSWIESETNGYGADAAIVTASANTAAPIELGAQLCRLRGRIVTVGALPLSLDRRIFYEKELELRLSRSYGPGRYDRRYEEDGYDYPLPYVRWTENRNMQAFLALVEDGAVEPGRLDVAIEPFENAVRVYEKLAVGNNRSLAVMYRYSQAAQRAARVALREPAPPAPNRAAKGRVGIGFIGAGNYARAVLLPALPRGPQLQRVTIATETGASARHAAQRFRFAGCATDPTEIFGDSSIDLVFIATRHDTHARLAVEALDAGKAVWLEKPLGLSPEEVTEVAAAVQRTHGFLAVGYNRRFSSHVRAIRRAFSGRQGPLTIRYSVAAGPPPSDTWITDPRVGGGRIVGEVCHFVDLCAHIVGMAPEQVFASAAGKGANDDSMVVLMSFSDGSTASIEYLARASDALPKERVEVSGGGRTVECEGFRVTRVYAPGPPRWHRSFGQDKGQRAAVHEVIRCVQEGLPSPMSLAELVAVSMATFAIRDSLRLGSPVSVPD